MCLAVLETSSLPLRPWDYNWSTTSVLDLRRGQDPYFPRGTTSMRRQSIDYLNTWSSDGTCSLFFSSMRWLIRLLQYSTYGRDMLSILHVLETTTIDYYGTRSEKRQYLKKSYSSTRWKSRKRQDLYIHTRWSIKKSPYKKNSPTHWPEKSYLHGKEKI